MFEMYDVSPKAFNHSFEDWRKCVHPEDLIGAEEAFKFSVESGGKYLYTFRIILSDGSIRHVKASASQRSINESGDVVIIGTNQDITSYINLQREAEKAGATYHQLVRQSPNAVAMVDKNMVYLACSDQWVAEYGLTRPVAGKSHYELFPEIGESWKAIHKKCLQGSNESNDKDLFVRADGSRQYLRWDIRPWRTIDEEVAGLIMFTEDITDRVNAEFEREELMEVLNASQKVAQIGSWKVPLPSLKAIWDEQTFNIHDLPVGEVPSVEQGINYYKEGHSRDTISKVFTACIEHQQPFDEFLELITAKGNHKWVRTIGRPVLDKAGKTIAVNGVFQDVTELKAREKELLEYTKRFESAFEHSAIGMALVGLDGAWLRVNSVLINYFGYSEEELLALTFQDITHPDDLEKDKEFAEKCVLGEIENYQIEKRYLQKNGSVFWATLSVGIVKDGTGEPLYFISQIEDISETVAFRKNFNRPIKTSPY